MHDLQTLKNIKNHSRVFWFNYALQIQARTVDFKRIFAAFYHQCKHNLHAQKGMEADAGMLPPPSYSNAGLHCHICGLYLYPVPHTKQLIQMIALLTRQSPPLSPNQVSSVIQCHLIFTIIIIFSVISFIIYSIISAIFLELFPK